MQSIYTIYINTGRDISYKHDRSLNFLTTYKWRTISTQPHQLSPSVSPALGPWRRHGPAVGLLGWCWYVEHRQSPQSFWAEIKDSTLHAGCRSISHRIHGTGIFTHIYLKNQPFMQVNIPFVPWILWVFSFFFKWEKHIGFKQSTLTCEKASEVHPFLWCSVGLGPRFVTQNPWRTHGTGIFIYIWLIFMVHVGKYTIHGSYGKRIKTSWSPSWGEGGRKHFNVCCLGWCWSVGLGS